MQLVLLGAPGAGKGTQAVLLAKKLSIPHVSTGDIMRAAVSAATPLGLKVKTYLDAGQLVPDELVIDVVKERLAQADCRSGFLLDGFPRTVDQAKALTAVFEEWGRKDLRVVELVVADEVLLDRIEKRGQAGSGRSDDSRLVAEQRLKEYWEKTAPVSKYYNDLGFMVRVNGIGSIDEVHERIVSELG